MASYVDHLREADVAVSAGEAGSTYDARGHRDNARRDEGT